MITQVLSLLLATHLMSALEGVGARRDSAITMLRSSPDIAIGLLDSLNWRGRDGIVSALETSDPPRVQELIGLAQSHPAAATRRSAIRSYGRVAPEGGCVNLLRLMPGFKDDKAIILDAMRDRLDCDHGSIEEYLTDGDADVRRRALALYSRISDSGSSRAVLALDDRDRSVRQAAASFLAQAGEVSIRPIVNHLPRLGRIGRLTAYRVLGNIPHTESETALCAEWSSDQWQTRYVISESLGQVGGPDSADYLKRQLLVEQHPLVTESIRSAVTLIEQREKEAVEDE